MNHEDSLPSDELEPVQREVLNNPLAINERTRLTPSIQVVAVSPSAKA